MTNTNTSCENIERKDKKVWKNYNPSLVKRIEVLMDTSFLNRWKENLERENEGKVGHPYEYPQEFFVFLSKIRSLWNVPFRELEAFVRKLSELTGKFRPLSYVAIFHHIRSIPIYGIMDEINKDARYGITVIIDSSGFKITDRGDWLSSKWNRKRKGWIKMHVAIDADKTNIVSLSITDERSHDNREFRKVLNPIADKVKMVYGDGAYDSRSNFNFLHNREIEAVIPPRENSSTLSRGSPYRAKTVRRIRRTGLDAWKKEVDYGKRWRVEIFFSALKRVVGEVIMAKKMMYQIQEAVMKIYTYFLLRKNAEVN